MNDPGGWPCLMVVIPARGDAGNLPPTIDAVRAQEYPGEREIIIALGHSKVGSEALAHDLASQDAAQRVVDDSLWDDAVPASRRNQDVHPVGDQGRALPLRRRAEAERHRQSWRRPPRGLD